MFGTRAPLVVDLFLLILTAILPALLVGAALARRRRIRAHAAVMVSCFLLFLVALAAFEIGLRAGEATPALPGPPLVVHLCFALPGLLLWVAQVATARGARRNPAPHRRRGRVLFLLLSATVATGFWLYVETFV